MKRIVNYRFFPSAAGPTYEAETIAYRDRVLADGGEVIDLDYVDSVYKKLKELSLLASLKHWSSARAGVRKDSANYVSKLYSGDSLSKDITQTTGAKQPFYELGFIVYDGQDDFLNNSSFGWQQGESVTVHFKGVPEVNVGMAFTANTDPNNRFSAHIPYNDKVLYWDYGNVNTGMGGRISANISNFILLETSFTLVSNAVNYKAIYANGSAISTNTDNINITALELPALDVARNASNGNAHKGKIKHLYFFNKALTAEQITALNSL